MNQIREILEDKKIAFELIDDELVVPRSSENGFDVTYTEYDSSYYVTCSSWHEEFDDLENAINCFMNSLTKRVRIEVSKKGNFEYKWRYEAFDGENWVDFGTTALIFFPYWRRTSIEYQINDHGL